MCLLGRASTDAKPPRLVSSLERGGARGGEGRILVVAGVSIFEVNVEGISMSVWLVDCAGSLPLFVDAFFVCTEYE